MTQRVRDPFGPIDWIVTFALTLVIVAMLLGTAWAGIDVAVTGSTDISIAGVGDDDACTEVSDQAVPSYASGGGGVRRAEGIEGFDRSAGRYGSTGWSICLRIRLGCNLLLRWHRSSAHFC